MTDKKDDNAQPTMSIDGHPDELMPMSWVAWRLVMKTTTLSNKIGAGSIDLPPPVLIGNGKCPTKRWKRSVINGWIDSLQAA